VDLELVEDLMKLRDTHTDRLQKEFKNLCGLEPTQTVAFRNLLLDDYLLDMPNLQKQTIEDTLENGTLDPTARRLLEIRASASQVAGKKLDAIERTGDFDGRIRDMTGRFAGRQVQLQNLARGKFKVSDEDPGIIRGLDPDDVDILYGVGPMEAVGTMIRPCITCDEGKNMYDADYASVEARGVAWLAGQDDLLRLFSQGQDVYKHQAALTFGGRAVEMTDEQRFLGKQQILGCGYQCGPDRFKDMCATYGVDISEDMAKLAVDTYRGSYKKIVQLWADAQEAFMTAIRHPGRLTTIGPVKIRASGRYLYARLPSGRTITYCMPSLVTVEKDFGDGPVKLQQVQYWGINSTTRKWMRQHLYGGKIVENLVQGMCRDLMCNAINNVVDAGFEVLFHVHDQIVSQYDNPDCMGRYIEEMTRLPQWARGFPLAAEGKVCQRFSK
jgi:DNA polymerase